MAELEDRGHLQYAVRSEAEGTTVLELSGELDLASTDTLDHALADVIAAVSGRLVIDAAQLRFADSSAIALWVKWARSVPKMEIRDTPPLVRRVIDAMGLTDLLNVS